ncbi:hypothetical protein [Candidatus Kuenenia sp.]|uniref:hypothetical protein n=1 Tax=Candidatus Kuenenia sp. TaxID=2499824 RepID=UPI00321FDC56
MVGEWYSADGQALHEFHRQKQSAVGNPQSTICRLPTVSIFHFNDGRMTMDDG